MARYRIPEENLERLRSEIDTLNKRARKLGVDAITLTVAEWEERQRRHPRFPDVTVTDKWAHVEITGATPKLGGWSFAAKIEPTEVGNLIKLLPGVENIPAPYYTADMTCDHCGTNRWRKEVFVVAHTDGRYAQVGRNCLADFLGGKSPERLAAMAELLASVGDLIGDASEGGWGGRAELTEPTPVFVAAVAAFARYEGYVSRKQADETRMTPTSQQAWRYLRPTGASDVQWIKDLQQAGFEIEARDVELANKAVEWAKGLEPNYDQNFLYNLKIAATREHTDHRSMGIVAAVVGSYMREVEKQEIARKRREMSRSLRHLGTVGKRDVFSGLTVAGTREFPGEFGVRTLVTFVDDEGNILTWWTGAAPLWAAQGVTVSVKATVKDHGEYQGEKQTVITRAAVV